MSEGGGLDYMELGGVVKNTSFDETHDEEPGPGTGELRRADSAEILHVSLHQGARDGNIDLMKRLVANITTNKKKRINLLDDDKMTPLHYAARYNNYHIVTLLVEHGADVRSIGED
uniref:Transient receptor potential cation channel subfamily A member 1 homolog n=1 Tax=Saccoglossus kowalevskii TaxID=10224 RepID=A0ABM0LZY0_SACKO